MFSIIITLIGTIILGFIVPIVKNFYKIKKEYSNIERMSRLMVDYIYSLKDMDSFTRENTILGLQVCSKYFNQFEYHDEKEILVLLAKFVNGILLEDQQTTTIGES